VILEMGWEGGEGGGGRERELTFVLHVSPGPILWIPLFFDLDDWIDESSSLFPTPKVELRS